MFHNYACCYKTIMSVANVVKVTTYDRLFLFDIRIQP